VGRPAERFSHGPASGVHATGKIRVSHGPAAGTYDGPASGLEKPASGSCDGPASGGLDGPAWGLEKPASPPDGPARVGYASPGAK